MDVHVSLVSSALLYSPFSRAHPLIQWKLSEPSSWKKASFWAWDGGGGWFPVCAQDKNIWNVCGSGRPFHEDCFLIICSMIIHDRLDLFVCATLWLSWALTRLSGDRPWILLPERIYHRRYPATHPHRRHRRTQCLPDISSRGDRSIPGTGDDCSLSVYRSPIYASAQGCPGSPRNPWGHHSSWARHWF